MDLTNILQGVTESLKSREDNNLSKGTSVTAITSESSWLSWPPEQIQEEDNEEDQGEDGWEDVTDVVTFTKPEAPATDAFRVENGSKAQAPGQAAPMGSENTESLAKTITVVPVVQRPSTETASDTADSMTSLRAQLRAATDRATSAERQLIALKRNPVDMEHTKVNTERIEALQAEGEILSRRIAEKEIKMRAVRTRTRELESQLEETEFRVQGLEAKLAASDSRMRQLETAERVALDAREVAERRLREIESSAREKGASSVALEAARVQLESLRNSQHTALQNQAMQLAAEHEQVLEVVRAKATVAEQAQNKTISELRAHLSQVVEQAGYTEDQLRKQMESLRMRAEALEARNEELTAALPNSTRPLLRQIEALQAAASERVLAKQAVKKSYFDRLRTAEAAAAVASERENTAEKRVSELVVRAAALEEQVKGMQAEAARGVEDVLRLQAELSSVGEVHQREVEALRVRISGLAMERDTALASAREERAARAEVVEQAENRELEMQRQVVVLEGKLRPHHTAHSTNSPTLRSPKFALGDDSTSGDLDGVSDCSRATRDLQGGQFYTPTREDLGSRQGEADSDGMYATERMATDLRLRRDEVQTLQEQIHLKEKATRALAEDVVSLTRQLEEATNQTEAAPQLRKRLKELDERHGTLLELLGEREERIAELEADLDDVKTIQKDQVTELLLRLEKACE